MAILNPFNRPCRPCDLKRLFPVWVVVSALLLSGAIEMPAQTKISREYQIKAAFLFNFAQFVTWPPDAFTNAAAPFRIGILGEDPFGAFLDETVRNEKVNGHPLVVQRYRSAKDIKDCQILFVSRSESRRVKRILADLKNRNILTVGDMEDLVESGGIIRFSTEKNKIHFQVNLEAAKNANLTISSKMLRLAEIVTPEKD